MLVMKLNMCLSYNLAIVLFLGIPEKRKLIYTKSYTLMFKAALFIKAANWK